MRPDAVSVDRRDRLAETSEDRAVSIVMDTDTDNEIDDQFAVAYALGAPNVSVKALYAAPFDNDRSTGPADGMRKSRAELERLLDRMVGVPAADGFVFDGAPSFMEAADAPVDSPATRDLIERAHADSTPLYVVAIGCPTNVASAMLRDPTIRDEIVVVWLGGHPHSWHTAAEFNLQQDLHASRVLFDSGVPLVQIPAKNVSEHLLTTIPELNARLNGHSPLGTYLYDIVTDYPGADQPWWGKQIWDLAAVAWVVDAGLVPSHLTHSPILTDGLTWSRNRDRHLIRVARDVDRDGIFRDFMDALATVT